MCLVACLLLLYHIIHRKHGSNALTATPINDELANCLQEFTAFQQAKNAAKAAKKKAAKSVKSSKVATTTAATTSATATASTSTNKIPSASGNSGEPVPIFPLLYSNDAVINSDDITDEEPVRRHNTRRMMRGQMDTRRVRGPSLL